jgi:hypothetical protein
MMTANPPPGPNAAASASNADANVNMNGSSKKDPIYVDTQHDDMIHDAQMDYYGTKLATSSSGKSSHYGTSPISAMLLLHISYFIRVQYFHDSIESSFSNSNSNSN